MVVMSLDHLMSRYLVVPDEDREMDESVIYITVLYQDIRLGWFLSSLFLPVLFLL